MIINFAVCLYNNIVTALLSLVCVVLCLFVSYCTLVRIDHEDYKADYSFSVLSSRPHN